MVLFSLFTGKNKLKCKYFFFSQRSEWESWGEGKTFSLAVDELEILGGEVITTLGLAVDGCGLLGSGCRALGLAVEEKRRSGGLTVCGENG